MGLGGPLNILRRRDEKAPGKASVPIGDAGCCWSSEVTDVEQEDEVLEFEPFILNLIFVVRLWLIFGYK